VDFLFPKGFKFPDIPSNFSLTGEPIFTIGPISYTNAHFTMLLVMILLSTFAFFATRNLREQPSGLQNVAEMLVQGLGDFVVSIGGPQAIKYLPLFGTLFLFIVTSNWLSVVPLVGQITWLHSPTADYHITLRDGLRLVARVPDGGLPSPRLLVREALVQLQRLQGRPVHRRDLRDGRAHRALQ